MTDVCGWVGFEDSDDEQNRILASMVAAASTPATGELVTLQGPGCALAVRPSATSVDVWHDDRLWVAVVGPVRFATRDLSERAADQGTAAAAATAYRELDVAAVDELSDAFALVVIEPQEARALLAVDRIGGRHPLSYKTAGESLVFGSLGGSLQAHPLGRSEVDPQALFDYVYFEAVPGPLTVRQGVRRLMPGEQLRFESGCARISRYWQLHYPEPRRGSVGDLVAELHRRLRRSVANDVTDDVGCFLSGGTDSSTVTGLVSEVSGLPARAYAIGFDAPGYDETGYARVAARHFGATLKEYYVTPEDVLAAIPKLAAAHSDPFGNASAVPAYYCAQMARADGVRRLLGGDGGDELFAGNQRYLTQSILGAYGRMPGLLRRALEPVAFGLPAGDRLLPVRKLRSYIRQAKMPMPQRMQVYNFLERMDVSHLFTPAFLGRVDPSHPLSLLNETYWGAHAQGMLSRMLTLDRRFTLADNDLPKVSRSCELAGIEVAYPLLSDEMVDFSRQVPPRLHLRWGRLRWFWKYALRDFLPTEVLKKSKHGFGLPFGLWMREHRGLRDMARDSLSSLAQRDVVRPEFIEELTRLHKEHASYYGVLIWLLLMLEQWFQAHAD